MHFTSISIILLAITITVATDDRLEGWTDIAHDNNTTAPSSTPDSPIAPVDTTIPSNGSYLVLNASISQSLVPYPPPDPAHPTILETFALVCSGTFPNAPPVACHTEWNASDANAVSDSGAYEVYFSCDDGTVHVALERKHTSPEYPFEVDIWTDGGSGAGAADDMASWMVGNTSAGGGWTKDPYTKGAKSVHEWYFEGPLKLDTLYTGSLPK